MEHTLKILSIFPVTHDVHCIRFEKPEGYTFTPGQATDVSINKEGWKDEKRPFTFTCLNEDPYLEFTIKSYNDHDGVTNQIGQLKAGDELIIDDPWGAIEYKGPGYFIAGGAGITPFIAILRQLKKDDQLAGNKLFFSNKTRKDIIYEQELKSMLGDDALYTLTEVKDNAYLNDHIDAAFFDKHVQDYGKQFYICGPDAMVAAISEIVTAKGADPNAVIFEK
jgi:ferredoxin-NADP reductase